MLRLRRRQVHRLGYPVRLLVRRQGRVQEERLGGVLVVIVLPVAVVTHSDFDILWPIT